MHCYLLFPRMFGYKILNEAHYVLESVLKLIRRIIIFQIFLWFACGMECNICISVFSSILKKFKKKVWNIITLIHYGKLEWGNDIFQLFIHPLKHLGWETCPSTGWGFNKMKFLIMDPALIRGNPSCTWVVRYFVCPFTYATHSVW